MSHPFGDLVSQHLHRKHGLSQSKLGEGILQPPAVISAMCKGRRLTGYRARDRVLAITGWLHQQGALSTLDEANALLSAAGMARLSEDKSAEAVLIQSLHPSRPSPNGNVFSPAQIAHRHNLPASVTALIGRDDDVAAANSLLRSPHVRLLTLLGPPGVGKTRLAIKVARAGCEEFADGAWFVPLAPVSDPQLVDSAIVQVLGLPNPGAPPLALLKAHLRDRQVMLLLDNFEHVLDARSTVSELLAAVPGVKILTTSRTALRLSGEHLFEVQPLTEPDAVTLFLQRAQAIKTGFVLSDANTQAVAEICRRLDRLPLAIELAAARVRMFDPSQLLARLSSLDTLSTGASDLPMRQRSLRNTIDWSYQLLSAEEQALLRRLSIFAGDCSLEAAERVAGDRLDASALDLLQALADKSLLKIETHEGEARCSLLEIIREYARAKLDASGEAEAVANRHAEYFVAYAETIEPKLNSPEQLIWTRRLDQDRDNLWAALTYARNRDDTLLQIRFMGALWPWFAYRAAAGDGWGWLSALFARRSEGQPKPMRARALLGAAGLLMGFESDWTHVRTMLEESLSLFRYLGDTRLHAELLATLAQLTINQGDYARASQYLETSVQLLGQIGDDLALAWPLMWQAVIARDQGEFERSARLFDQSLTRYRLLHNQGDEALTIHGMGDLAFNRGDYAEALARYEEARLMWWEALGIDFGLALRGPGRIAYIQGDLTRAHQLLETGVANSRNWRRTTPLQWCLHHLGFVKHLLGDEVSAHALLHEAITLQRGQSRPLAIAESLERFAWMAANQHRPHRAARLFGAADVLRKWMGTPLPLGDKPLYDRYLEMTRATMGAEAFDQTWADGAAMSLDQAVAYALSMDESRELHDVQTSLSR